MTPQQAIEILSQATEPQNAPRITRGGYAQIEEALKVLAALLPSAAPKAD